MISLKLLKTQGLDAKQIYNIYKPQPNKSVFLSNYENQGTFAKEHVPDAQNRCKWKRPTEDAHEPFGHYENWVNLLFLL